MIIFKILQALIFGGILTVSLEPSEHRGVVKLGDVPVPGAVVTALQNDKKLVAVTDAQGQYAFPDLTDGTWTLQVEMLGFESVKKEVSIAAGAPATEWTLRILSISEIGAVTVAATKPPDPPAPQPARAATPPPPPRQAAPTAPSDDTANDLNNDGVLINGSVNNGAASPFAQAAAFGNARRTRALYNGGIGFQMGNSALDARAYSLTGLNTLKPSYNLVNGGFTFGGPLRIPRILVRSAPQFVVNYQRVQNRTATTQSVLMPTLAERNGDLSARGVPIIDPSTGTPFAGNQIPSGRISSQAKALLGYFPAPNFESGTPFNYQIPLISATHTDNIQARVNRNLNTRNAIAGEFGFQRTAADTPNVFAFLDKSHSLGFNAAANYVRRIGQRASVTLRYQFSRSRNRLTPYFANRFNVSGDAGIKGNNQEPLNWGPPALIFSGGITGLSDGQSALTRNQTNSFGFSGVFNRGRHTLQYGGDYRKQQFNLLSQQDPRGTFTFTGAASGSDFADFLLGIPSTSSIAYGNADKYLRQSVYDAFVSDDFRVRSGLTLNVGARWEYEAPVTEKYDRFVNLQVSPDFSSATPVIGQKLFPDRKGIQPRLSMAWRPLPASSLIVRASYGMYRNSGIYQNILTQMAQQAPLSRSLSVQNSAANPLTLENGFVASGVTTTTFAVDPNLRVGTSHNWTASVQRDLPASLMIIATYLGTKGTHLMQEFLPNTYPTGVASPCPSCPTGFAYLTSNGGSRRDAGQVQVRRRLHNGFTANIQYTLAKATDDAGFSAANPLIAQNWLDLKAEEAPSSFDQRHQVTAQAQYTSGMGARGGALMDGWRGTVLKEWTITTQITVGSGLPLTPIYLAAAGRTGITGSIRPDYIGGSEESRSSYSAPASGRWGTAGRNSIVGPKQFGMNASLARTLRLTDRVFADLRVDATNVLNHVTYPTWNMVMTSPQFGLPTRANDMRKIQSSLRIRF